MTEFNHLVSGERRRLEEQAAAERRRREAERTRQDAWEHDELRGWQKTIGRIQELFAAATERLTQEHARPFPVLEHRAPRPGPMSLESVDRTIITGYRWQFEGAFALDKRCRAYKVTAPGPLMAVDRRSQWSVRKRMSDYLLHGQGLGASTRLAMLSDKSLLRTGLQPDDLVLWAKSDDRIEFDPAAALRAGQIHCFRKADDGTPLLMHDSATEPLEAFIARATARILAQKDHP
ncbi:MAG TPA: hypothetical protein VMU94_10700 [Streptosporangiaceae bacterium]|nr:hypothetical protein [Streptosporangiaceae bacterium]